jgi:hypothetical protein
MTDTCFGSRPAIGLIRCYTPISVSNRIGPYRLVDASPLTALQEIHTSCCTQRGRWRALAVAQGGSDGRVYQSMLRLVRSRSASGVRYSGLPCRLVTDASLSTSSSVRNPTLCDHRSDRDQAADLVLGYRREVLRVFPDSARVGPACGPTGGTSACVRCTGANCPFAPSGRGACGRASPGLAATRPGARVHRGPAMRSRARYLGRRLRHCR